MEIKINKGDSYEATLRLKEKGMPINMSDSTLVIIVKKEGTDDEDAKFVQILPEKSGENGEIEIEVEGIDERGEYVLYIKSLDGEKRYTLSEIPFIVK